MTIANYISVNPEMMSTRTAKDFCALLGASPHNLGIAARLYEKHTASYFTEAFGNVVNVNSKSESKYQPINSLMVEWEVEVQNVPRIPFATSVPDTFRQARGVDIPMAFTEKYYGVNDTFIIDESKQICVVIDEPIRKADNMWEYAVQLIDADFNAELDTDACQAGCLTRWIGNIKPELHETGNVKYTSNYQKMRSWIGEMRFQADVSDRYLAMEDTFVKVSRESESGTKNYLFKLPAIKKVLLDNFMDGRNNQMIWGKSTMDEQGHCTVRDRQGRDLICGDGIVAQINRYACKYAYTKLSANVLTEALSVLAEKCEESIGNTLTTQAWAA